MERWLALLMELPDEIILLIFNKLNNIDVLYSLMNVNPRLDRILHDAMFTKKIALVQTLNSEKRPDEKLLDRFCLEILPKIHHQIEWLSVDSLSLERILLAADYPNLYQLDILITNKEPHLHLTDQSSVVRIFQNQIVNLSVDGKMSYEKILCSTMDRRGNLLSHILNMFTSVLYLKFFQPVNLSNRFVAFNSKNSEFCSNLVELHISVYLFDDCLYLLDGRLNQLRRFFVHVHRIFPPIKPFNDNRNELTQLKEFSLSSTNETFVYDEVLVPHLRRMINLESLTLYLLIEEKEKFIDGLNLTRNILSYMPHLNQFRFNIRSIVSFDNQLHFPSNEEIQRSFTNCTDDEVICYVDYFPSNKTGQCCVYTNPYPMLRFNGITNSFPGGLFKYVRCAALFDERPFEHTFFLSIAQAFPSLERLTIENFQSQISKDDQDNNNNRHLPMIEYPHLVELELFDIHDDYAEQFLFHTKASFSNPIYLLIRYDTIERVTHHFTRDATRVNCQMVERLCITGRSNIPEHLYLYFSCLK